MKIFLLATTVLIISAPSAWANTALTGRTLSCQFTENLFAKPGLQKDNYYFSVVDGDDVAVYSHKGSVDYSKGVAGYKIKGNTVSIENGTLEGLNYDLSDPTNVVRPFKLCVSSPYGGTTCENITEYCVLN